MKKFVKYNNLFDCYESLLTENERDCFKKYYEEDLSLQEIAEINNVSRSAIHKTIKIVEEKLDTYEINLKLCKVIDKLKLINDINNVNLIKKKIKEILEDL